MSGREDGKPFLRTWASAAGIGTPFALRGPDLWMVMVKVKVKGDILLFDDFCWIEVDPAEAVSIHLLSKLTSKFITLKLYFYDIVHTFRS
jgi:hypothetical protein